MNASSRPFFSATSLALAVVLAIAAAPSRAASPSAAARSAGEPALRAPFVPGQAIVRFADGVSEGARLRALRVAGATRIRRLAVRGYELVSLAAVSRRALAALTAREEIVAAEPNLLARVQLDPPSDPCMNATASGPCPGVYHLWAVAAQAGWSRYPAGYFSPAGKLAIPPAQRIKVAVLDTQVQTSNADFRNGGTSEDAAAGGQIDLASVAGFRGLPQEFGPASFHGTYVAGILAASADNGNASAGVAYNAELIPLSVVHGNTGEADAATLADGIVYAFSRGARVINLSLGLLSPSGVVDAAIREVTSAASPPLVVAAAGNYNNDQPFYPAWFDNVLAVGGTDQLDRKASCANFGSKIAVVAPAKNVPAITSDGFMITPDCGTSAATPQVSALAALLFAQNPARTAAQVRSIIEQTADDLGAPGRDDLFGWGRINVDRALSFGVGPQTRSLRATPVRAGGGSSSITAAVTASGVVRAAEMFVDRMPTSGSDRGFPVSPADGAFDSAVENVTGAYAAGGLSLGAHRVYVRAMDSANVWGPVASATLYVDGVTPTITSLRATGTVRPLDRSSTITFIASDDYSTTINYDVDVMLAGQPGLQVAHAERIVAPVGSQTYAWSPRSIELPGSYTVRVTLRDGVGNTSAASTTFVLV